MKLKIKITKEAVLFAAALSVVTLLAAVLW